jgi:hypothetical protein
MCFRVWRLLKLRTAVPSALHGVTVFLFANVRDRLGWHDRVAEVYMNWNLRNRYTRSYECTDRLRQRLFDAPLFGVSVLLTLAVDCRFTSICATFLV